MRSKLLVGIALSIFFILIVNIIFFGSFNEYLLKDEKKINASVVTLSANNPSSVENKTNTTKITSTTPTPRSSSSSTVTKKPPVTRAS